MGLNGITRQSLTDTALQNLPEEYMVRVTSTYKDHKYSDGTVQRWRDKSTAEVLDVATGAVLSSCTDSYTRRAIVGAIINLKEELKKPKEDGIKL